MTREEAIEILQEEHDWVQEPCYVINAINKAIEALRTPTREQVQNGEDINFPTSPPKPLTVDELRQMSDEPVYLQCRDPEQKSGWYILKGVFGEKILFRGYSPTWIYVDGLGVDYDLYPYPAPQWISVDSRVPEIGKRVLATDGVFVGEAFANTDGTWLRYTALSWVDLLKSRITHWMPLPPAPEDMK